MYQKRLFLEQFTCTKNPICCTPCALLGLNAPTGRNVSANSRHPRARPIGRRASPGQRATPDPNGRETAGYLASRVFLRPDRAMAASPPSSAPAAPGGARDWTRRTETAPAARRTRPRSRRGSRFPCLPPRDHAIWPAFRRVIARWACGRAVGAYAATTFTSPLPRYFNAAPSGACSCDGTPPRFPRRCLPPCAR